MHKDNILADNTTNLNNEDITVLSTTQNSNENPRSVSLLDELLLRRTSNKGGKPISVGGSRETQRRRVNRTLSGKVAAVFGAIIADVNKVYGLDLHPLTLKKVISVDQEVQNLLVASDSSKTNEILAQSCVDMTKSAGRGCNSGVLGTLARKNAKGKVSVNGLAQKTGFSKSYIYACKKKVSEGNLGAFGMTSNSGLNNMQRICPTRLDATLGDCKDENCKFLHECVICNDGSKHCAANCPSGWTKEKAQRAAQKVISKHQHMTRQSVEASELFATRAWTCHENPARSGDQKEIVWMMKGRRDFYDEDYRLLDNQLDIIRRALREYGDKLSGRARETCVKGRWLYNIRNYLRAVDKGEVHLLQIPLLTKEKRLNYNTLLQETIEINKDQASETSDDFILPDSGEPPEEIDDEIVPPQYRIVPASYKYYYGKLLECMRLWRRPPDNHCTRCAEFHQVADRITELRTALSSTSNNVNYQDHQRVLHQAKGRLKAEEELRKLDKLLPNLQKHVEWKNTARSYLLRHRATMKPTMIELQLDYGGFTDSANQKVSVWSVTAIPAPITEKQQEHFDFFFDQASSKTDFSEGTAKKDGLTGKAMLQHLFDPEYGKDNVSLFMKVFPSITDIILSGDTGNGYRAYEMLEELSCFMEKYGYRVKLIPLAPGHAWNRTDARIAHMNTFLNAIKSKSRVFGAEQIALAFRCAADPRLKNQKKYMARSHIKFVEVKVDREDALEKKKLLGAFLHDEHIDKKKMGVRGFLFFDFSVYDDAKQLVYLPGYARVREHADPTRSDNRTHLWTWRKDLTQTICQKCSTKWGGPVLLTKHGCTKRICVMEGQDTGRESYSTQNVVAPTAQPDLCQETASTIDDALAMTSDIQPVVVCPPKTNVKTSIDKRQVRCIHGTTDDEKTTALWFYIPEKKSASSGSKRKGWWLLPEPNKPGMYFISYMEWIQKNRQKDKVEDVAVFNDFPFVRTVETKANGAEIPATVRCVTERPFNLEELAEARNGTDAVELEYLEEGDRNNDSDYEASDCEEPTQPRRVSTRNRKKT